MAVKSHHVKKSHMGFWNDRYLVRLQPSLDGKVSSHAGFHLDNRKLPGFKTTIADSNFVILDASVHGRRAIRCFLQLRILPMW